ncbi:MAG: DUF308 domain-containing protein [Clostridia bacterium]|nr:DUF308 domain-containing protein [Clostridia bacterium]
MNFKSLIETLKKNWIVSSAITALIGLVLVLFPTGTLKVISYVIGALAVVMGVIRTVRYFKQDHTYPFLFQSDLLVGLLSIGFGLFLIISAETVISMVPFVFGILLIGCGVGNVLRAIDAKNAGLSSWAMLMALAVISIAVGIICMANPFTVMETAVIVIGAALIYVGITDIVTTVAVSKRIRLWKGASES